jgi:hypothetical protein
MLRLIPSHWNRLRETASHSYQSTASSSFLNFNGTFSFICYNNVILLQSQPLRTFTLQALQSKSAYCSRPSPHVSHIAFLLDSWSSVRKFTYSYCHFTNPTKSSDQMRPLLFAPSIYPCLVHYPRELQLPTAQARISNLVRFGADISLQTPQHLWAPIFCAACHDNAETFQALPKLGTKKGKNGAPPAAIISQVYST